jgi:hypothetical protein
VSRAPDHPDRLDWPRPGLSARSTRVCIAACEALLADYDDEGRLVPGNAALCERTVASFDMSVGRGSTDLRRGFGVLSLALELLPLFIIGAFSRMSRLSIERRVAYFEALEASRIGLLSMLFVAFKLPLCIPAFEEGEELLSTGFDRESTVSRRSLPTVREQPSSPPPEVQGAPSGRAATPAPPPTPTAKPERAQKPAGATP